MRPSEPGVLEQLFSQMSQLPKSIFLDSSINTKSAAGDSLGRYSFLAAEPVHWYESQADCPQPFDLLRQQFSHFESTHLPELPPFQGGLAGLFSYDLNRSLETLDPPQDDAFKIPLLAFGVYDVVIGIDHVEDTIHVVSQGLPERAIKQRERKAKQRLDYFLNWLTTSKDDNTPPANQPTQSPPGPKLAFPIEGSNGLFSNFTKASYLKAAQKCIDYIYEGDVFQVNLAQQLMCRATRSSADLYRRMRTANPAPFSAFMDLGPAQIISASPERFLKVHDRVVETRPIKGTRPRTRHPEVDITVGQQLTKSEKDRAENIMIVDLMRNDLARVCHPDSVDVTQCCELESYQSVLHLVSAVNGTLKEEFDLFDLLTASFPGGSITGAPKIRAMQIIQELEPTARGAYCGSLGYIGMNGDMDLNILIRTITARDGWWQIPVGGGIVSQSNPEDEYRETWTKAEGMLKAIGL